ncbi:uncharacterized protein WM277_008610 [Molossus nigricans]
MRRAASSPSAPTFVLALIRLIRTKTSASRIWDGLEGINTADGRPDLRDDPLPSSDEVLFTDGSNYVQEDISSYRPCSLPRRLSINTSTMPCLCPPQTLLVLDDAKLGWTA